MQLSENGSISFVVLLLERENLREKVDHVAGIAQLHIKEARADSNSVLSRNVGQVTERCDLARGKSQTFTHDLLRASIH
jgi:hypothetical protein